MYSVRSFFSHTNLRAACADAKTLLGHASNYNNNYLFGTGIEAIVQIQQTCRYVNCRYRETCEYKHRRKVDFMWSMNTLPWVPDIKQFTDSNWDEQYMMNILSTMQTSSIYPQLCPVGFGLLFFKDPDAEKALLQLLHVVKAFSAPDVMRLSLLSRSGEENFIVLIKHLILGCYRYPAPAIVGEFNHFWKTVDGKPYFKDADRWVRNQLA